MELKMLKFMKDRLRRADRGASAMLDIRTLRAMDNRMLRDIGVTRAQIDEAQRRVRWLV